MTRVGSVYGNCCAAVLGGALLVVGMGPGLAESEPGAQAPAPASAPAAYTKQGFLDAALRNCLEIQNRPPRSCQCEQQLVDSDRLTDDDKEMAFHFWTNKEEFAKRFKAKVAADAKWQPQFAQKFGNLQALIISACGK